ncbi:MAG TPA: ATP-dependent zinc metalloprotease FtsH, partial [Thermodesulfovibrionales bacterium]|nr:ATP-dependent zinc metalloprotease FtsH [Thermodesulfovibrionales bacterium]
QTQYPISYSQFMEQLDSANIKAVSIKKLRVSGEFLKEIRVPVQGEKKSIPVKNFQTFLPSFQGEDLLTKMREKNVGITVESPEQESILWQILIGILPWVLIIGVWILIMRRTQQIQGGPGGLFTFGSSKAKLYDVKKPSVTFRDVAGMDNVKRELRETIEFLKDPSRYTRLGAKVPKGVLLIGPPGTGKTLLARATAGEAGVPFYSISASEFIEMFVGVGASRVRDMFKKAKEAHPSIIFIDEIDSVGRTRGTGLGGGHDEREQTLNQLLSEMDGFDPHEEVIVMAATNRPDVLDPALLRPGRFDRHIVIDRPGWKERKGILEVHVRGKILGDDVNLEAIAKGTPGMTGADLENLTNEAALVALRKNKEKIAMRDFEEARDIILMGAVREETISDIEKKITAYHEAGHALVAWELPGTDPIYKVSIIPRGMAMGVTQLLPEEDRHYYPKTYLMNRLSVALAGRGAERLIFKDISSGAQNDLKEATSLAEKMVAQWGMSDKVGPLNLGRGEEHPFLGRELSLPKRYSEEMAWIMDQEIQRFVSDAESKAEEILTRKREVLDRLAEALMKDESLDKAEVEKIMRGSGERGNAVQ